MKDFLFSVIAFISLPIFLIWAVICAIFSFIKRFIECLGDWSELL